MAEEGSVYELEGLEKQLQSLLSRRSSDELRTDSKRFCTEYCKLVEEHASRWQLPLPQLRVLEMALCYFARASSSFTSNCDSVLNTLSSLALSVFELLLFFDEKDFHQEPLKKFTVTFQECHLALARHQNVHLLQVERLVQAGGAWASSALQAILSESSLPQNEVDGCLNSELPVFFELRVRYLFSCKRVSEAIALAKCCARHPTAGQHLFFLQVYLSWLYKTSQHDYLRNEVADISGKDAVYIICSLECEETDEILLALSRAFLSQQLSRGDMYHLCDLVFIWSKLHSRLNTSKQALLEESHQLMRFATNVNSIFPFIRVVLQELGEDGIQFCVELCANALESCLSCDILTKSLIYKTIAGLLPNDLEVCRACALLVFFLERSVDAYKMVYLLYMHPDQEYHVEHSPIRNHIRFETLQVLKKDLYFDPEFWNLIALRTNCLKLMSEKVVGAALEELMEEKWISSYCAKEMASESGTTRGQKGRKGAAGKRRHQRVDGTDMAPKRLRQGKLRKDTREASSDSMRRSFWQLDRIQDNGSFGHGQQRRTTRLSEKNPPKRRIRTPKWLLEDSGTLEKSVPSKIKRHGLKHQKEHQSSVVRRSDTVKFKNNSKHKSSVNSQLKTRENNTKGCSLDSPKPACPPQVILELSLPDNELMGTFTEDTCNRHRGYPQMLLYKQTVKLPAMPQTSKTVHGKEVILRARDANMFVQLLHCYGRRQKGKGNLLNIHASVSTITRSSARGSPPKDSHRELQEKLCDEMKGGIPSQPLVSTELTAKVPETQNTEMASQKVPTTELFKRSPEIKVTVPSQTSVAVKITENTVFDEVPQAQAGEEISETQKTSPMELCEEPAVEMKVTIASQTPAIDKVSKSQTVEEVSKTAISPEVSNTLMTQKGVTVSSMPNNYDHIPSQSQEVFDEDEELNLKSLQKCNIKNIHSDPIPGETHAADYDISQLEITRGPMKSDLSLVTEVVTEFTSLEHSRDQEKELASHDIAFKESVPLLDSKPNAHHKVSSLSVAEQDTSADADVQDVKEEGTKLDGYSDDGEPMDSAVESEESRLEFCCTFCNKDFKGSRVVGHAMFHFRKDECMFCGTAFKDDLLAMMHLSDHIEKLKRAAGSCKAQENRLSETKDTSTTKTSPRTKSISMSPGHRSSKRLRKSSISLKALSQESESRKLRSNDKSAECQFSQKNKQNKVAGRKSTIHNVNGHIGKKKPFDKMEKDPSNSQVKQNKLTQNKAFDGVESPTFPETCPILGNSSSPIPTNLSSFKEDEVKERESMHILKNATKQNGKGDDRNVEPQEKLSCPAEGCTWFTDMSKNRVALLYHALDEHHGDIKPLELSFHVGNSRCSICMRVLWSFEHFQHHVERHQVTPRHPCPHQGCTARFKTAMEMRRHARRHSPLQAVCCQPGCSQLFICLWALNLHEREHYAAKHTKPVKGTHVQKSNDKHGTQVERKQCRKPKDSASMVKKAGRKVRGQNLQNTARNDIVANPSTLKLTVVKKEQRVRHESKDSHVLKNLSNKDATTQLATPNLRLRHTPRKGQVPKSNLMVSKKVFSSTLLKRNTNKGHKLRQKQELVDIQCRKRRGRPPKVKKAVHDENAAAQKNETVKNQTDKTPPTSAHETAETPTVSNIFQAEEKERLHAQHVEVTETSRDESKKSTNEEKGNHFKQNEVSHHSTAEEKDINKQTSPSSENKTRKLTADTLKKLRNLMKRCAPNNQNASLGPSAAKKPRITNKVNERKCHHKQLDISNGSKQPDISKSTVPQVDDEVVAECLTREESIAKSEHADLPQVPDDSKPTAKNPISDKEHKKKCTKSQTKKGRPPKETHSRTASTHSVRANKHKCDKKTGLVKRSLKDPRKVLPSKKTAKSKSEVKLVEVTAQNCHSTKEKSRDSTPDGPSSAVPAVTTLAKKKGLNKSLVSQNSNKAKKEDKEQIVKKKGLPNDEGIQLASTTESKVSQVTEVKAQEVESSSVDKQGTTSEQPPKFSKSGYTLIVHGKSANEDEKSTVSIDALAEYGKKPYLRPPPSVYLDEKYTTMPKRRKEVSVFQVLQKSVPPEQAHIGTAAQRQRCANCFATFDNAVELQSHLQLQSCSNLFGFDSDEDGTS